MPAAEVPPPAFVVKAPGGGPKAVLRRRSGRFSLRLPGGLEADLGRAPSGSLEPRRSPYRARFVTPAGKRRVHRLTGRRLTVAGVEVLATADGVAFRSRSARFDAPRSTRAWLQRYTGAYEKPYKGVALAKASRGRYAFPALLRHRGRYTLLAESGVRGDEAGHLRVGRDLKVREGGGLWRVAVTGSIADVVESDLPLALGRRSRIADTSWIEPGRAAWSWLSDRASPTRLESQKHSVDLAASMGWEYVTVDEGWDPSWMTELVAYAAERDVRVVLWFDQADLSRPAVRSAARWGIAGIKADFFHSDSADSIARMDDIASWAAHERLVVAFHGCTVPRGLQRTWPNVLTVEAVRGAEHGRTGARDDVNLAFTRNPVGSMDFTPAGAGVRDLARAIVFESGLQHFGGAPHVYAGADRILREVPAAWDETRLLTGRPDRHAVIARRDGRRWFAGGLTAGPARELDVRLPAGRWDVHLVAEDGTRELRGRRSLTIRGDFAAILTPAG